MTRPARRRILLHIGTPKTGTSAIQFALYASRENLRSHGILYPVSLVGSPSDPKHQPLFDVIRSGDSRKFAESLDLLESELTDDVHTVVLSSEGFYHHQCEFGEASWRLVNVLSLGYFLRIVVYVRPQTEYLESVYRQYLKNPRGINEEYASAMTIHELVARPRIRQNLDYYGSLERWSAVVGDENMVVRRYTKTVVEDLFSHLGLTPANAGPHLRQNLSLTREMAELLRRVNSSLDDWRRDALIGAMEKAVQQSSVQWDETILSPFEAGALSDLYRECNIRVGKRWLNGDELFPGYEVRRSEPWEALRIDSAELLSTLGKYVEDPSIITSIRDEEG